MPGKSGPRLTRLGYWYNDGGLTNQKLALLGLFFAAYTGKKHIFLPMMACKDHLTSTAIPIKLGEVFELGPIKEFAKRYGVVISREPPDQLEIGGWNYFEIGAALCSEIGVARNQQHQGFVTDFFACLLPLVLQLESLQHLASKIFNDGGMSLAAQFRFEADWRFYSLVTLRPTVHRSEDFFLEYDGIVPKITAVFPDIRKIFVCCDEAALALSKEEIRQNCLAEFDVEPFWKTDFIQPAEFASFNNLERAIIDFEIALGAKNYVGLSRSTFSNLITFTKFCRNGKTIVTDYIYNHRDYEIRLRTDNGGETEPEAATQ